MQSKVEALKKENEMLGSQIGEIRQVAAMKVARRDDVIAQQEMQISLMVEVIRKLEDEEEQQRQSTRSLFRWGRSHHGVSTKSNTAA